MRSGTKQQDGKKVRRGRSVGYTGDGCRRSGQAAKGALLQSWQLRLEDWILESRGK